jgi:DNA-directed RNA polymerase subunit RPC12/RpoP
MNENIKRNLELMEGIERYKCPECNSGSFVVKLICVTNGRGQELYANPYIFCDDCKKIIGPYNPAPLLPA